MAYADQPLKEFAPSFTAIGAAFVAFTGEFPDEPGITLSDIEPTGMLLLTMDLLLGLILDERIENWREMTLQELVDAGKEKGLSDYRMNLLQRNDNAA